MKNIRIHLLFMLVIGLFASFISITHSTEKSIEEKIKWVKLEELAELQTKEQRPIMIDMYTDWCGYCKLMDRNTFSKEKVVSYINKNFYAVKFNAESTHTHKFFNQKFASTGKTHTFTRAYLRSGGYPTIIYFDSKGNKVGEKAGYKPAKTLLKELSTILERTKK